MTLYARINPDTQQPEARDFAAEPSFAKGWRPLTIEAQPTPSATQYVVPAAIVFGPLTATQGWVLVDKTAAELEAESLKDEKAQLDGWLTDVQTQLALDNAARALLTNLQRINELEKDTRVLLKVAKRYVRQQKQAL
jgi:hypothetical protein